MHRIMAGQRSLNNFYQSVQFTHPALADALSDDIQAVAIHALAADKSPGQVSADRLRRMTHDLPEIHRRVLENALTELGYLC